MKSIQSTLALRLLILVLVAGVLILSFACYQEYSTALYDSWGYKLASELQAFENGLVEK